MVITRSTPALPLPTRRPAMARYGMTWPASAGWVRLQLAVLVALGALAGTVQLQSVPGCPAAIDTLMEGTGTGFGNDGELYRLRKREPVGQELWRVPHPQPVSDPNLVITIESLSIRIWRDSSISGTFMISLRHDFDGPNLFSWPIKSDDIPRRQSNLLSDIVDAPPVTTLPYPPNGPPWNTKEDYVLVLGG